MRHTSSSQASKRMSYDPANQNNEQHLSYIEEGRQVIENIFFGIDYTCKITPEAQELALRCQRGQLETA